MARPRSFDRDAALDTALQHFWRCGYESTSIAQLTGAIGINPPSLYAAFGDKEELFQAAADRYIATFRTGLAGYLAAPTARGAMHDLLLATARIHTEPGTPPGCFVLYEPRLHDERALLRDALAARLRQGQADGDLTRDADPDGLADFLTTVLVGMSARARDDGTRAELTRIAESALSAIPS